MRYVSLIGKLVSRYLVSGATLEQNTVYNLSTMEEGKAVKLTIMCMKTSFTDYIECPSEGQSYPGTSTEGTCPFGSRTPSGFVLVGPKTLDLRVSFIEGMHLCFCTMSENRLICLNVTRRSRGEVGEARQTETGGEIARRVGGRHNGVWTQPLPSVGRRSLSAPQV